MLLQMAMQFVEGVMEFRKMYLSHVEDLFHSHPLFISALDRVSLLLCCFTLIHSARGSVALLYKRCALNRKMRFSTPHSSKIYGPIDLKLKT